jgi:hypothetical protein
VKFPSGKIAVFPSQLVLVAFAHSGTYRNREFQGMSPKQELRQTMMVGAFIGPSL